MSEEKAKGKESISRHKFFFEIPLYSSIKLEDLGDEFDSFFDGDVDAYNPNGFDTTYEIEMQEMRKYFNYNKEWHLPNFKDYYTVSLICRRKYDILRFFYFF